MKRDKNDYRAWARTQYKRAQERLARAKKEYTDFLERKWTFYIVHGEHNPSMKGKDQETKLKSNYIVALGDMIVLKEKLINLGLVQEVGKIL